MIKSPIDQKKESKEKISDMFDKNEALYVLAIGMDGDNIKKVVHCQGLPIWAVPTFLEAEKTKIITEMLSQEKQQEIKG